MRNKINDHSKSNWNINRISEYNHAVASHSKSATKWSLRKDSTCSNVNNSMCPRHDSRDDRHIITNDRYKISNIDIYDESSTRRTRENNDDDWDHSHVDVNARY